METLDSQTPSFPPLLAHSTKKYKVRAAVQQTAVSLAVYVCKCVRACGRVRARCVRVSLSPSLSLSLPLSFGCACQGGVRM